MKTKIISIIVLFLAMAFAGMAQNQDTTSSETAQSGFAIHSVNFTAGYFSPEMDYWNDTYLPAVGISETFDGNMTFGANITFSLPADFRTRVGASYWSGKVEGTSTSSIDELKIGFTRFNLGLLYAPKSIAFSGFQPYVGLEAQAFLIKNEYTIGATSTTQNGQDMSFAPVIGIDRTFGALNCGLEFKYNMGNYIQEETNEGTIEHEVSVNGAEVCFVIGYRF